MKPVDRHLDELVVGAVVREQFPDIACEHVTRVGAGWDNEVFLVDGRWMFRFPRNRDQLVWQEREIELMPVVSEALGPLVPRFERIGEPTATFPYPFVGYQRIDGVGADTVVLAGGDGLARDVAAAFTRTHAIEPSLITRTPEGWEDEAWDGWRVHDPEDVDDLPDLLPADIRERARPFITGAVPPPPGRSTRVVHNDICADHVLVDAATGRLTGLIDWADMMVGDAVVDFVGLIQIGGWDFVRRVLAHYRVDVDDTFFDRLVWAARTLTLHWLAELNDEEDIDPNVTDHGHLLWIARAFEEP